MMERNGNKLLKLLTAAAGLILLVAFAAPNAFAFGGGGVSFFGADAPAAGSPATGLPAAPFGMPSSRLKARMAGAPVGALEAQAMTSGLTRQTTNPFATTLTQRMHKVELGRYERTTVAREIAVARSKGFKVPRAEMDELLGSEALRYGNHHAAVAYYNRAENELGATGYPAPELKVAR